MSWPWSQLGLPGPSGLSEVRHAYAEKLKTTHPEEDPEGFQRLHSAYQLASRMARQQKKREKPFPQAEDTPPSRYATREDDVQEIETPEEKAESEKSDFDYEELIQKEGERPQFSHRDDERDFDYEELLQEEGERPQFSHRDDERDFDFDELLDEDGELPHPPEEDERDFDFERLFAEGEAERAEARRRRGEERRKAQRQQFQERRRQWRNREEQLNLHFRQREERWQGTETILHTIEMMYSAQAGAEQWQKFFQSPLFQRNKGTLDLIFGLEDFVSAKSLTQKVKLALFQAYGFDKGVSRPELRPLYQMLLPAWRAANSEKNHERNLAILGVVLGLAFPFVLGPLLDWGLIPSLGVSLGVVWIVWVVRKVVITGNLERRARGQKVSKKQERRSILLGVACVAALVVMMSWARTHPGLDLRDLLPTKDPREQTCQYIERDYGVEVASLYNQYPTEDNSNLFYLEPDVSKVFLAGPDGDRDIKHGKAGYTTNLPEMLMYWALKEFAQKHDMPPVNSLDQDLGRGDVSGTFIITLPEEDGEEIIEDLGALLEELREEKWYDAVPSNCGLVLCSREMEEGRIVLIRINLATEVYSTSQIQSLYKDGFAHAVCAQILKELELDWDFVREAGERYELVNGGMARMWGVECVKLLGLDGDGAVAMEYYVYPKLRNIYCVPGNFWETGNTEDQLGFYRLLYWGDRGTFMLFYPWTRVD